MEYVDGPSCADLLREHKMLDIDWTVHLLRDSCHGLDYAHRAGVVHRDVKPGNLLVARETNTTKLADFGIAKAAEQTRITQVGAVLGTAAYLSPEQARGEEAGPASDLYSLGVCAYQFLTGRLPHEYASLTELALKQQQDPVQPITALRPDVPPELDDAVRLCLERDPGNRYRSALELGQALEAGLHGELTDATRRMPVSDTDATRALAATEMTSSTRAMPRTSYAAPAPTSERAYAQPTAPPARRESRDAARAAGRRRMASMFALLLVLAAVAAVAIALLASNEGNTNVQAPDANDVQQQIDELREFIGENSP
jgi:serine/threonine-protein kinase